MKKVTTHALARNSGKRIKGCAVCSTGLSVSCGLNEERETEDAQSDGGVVRAWGHGPTDR